MTAFFSEIFLRLKRDRKRVFLETFLIIVLCAVTLFLFYFSASPENNSDSTVAVFEALDVAQGNVFLKGWYLSELNFYFSETVPKVFMLFLGFSPKTVLYLAPAFFWGLIVYLALKIALKKSETISGVFWILMGLIGIPAPFFLANVLKNDNIHVGCLIVGLFLILRMGERLSVLEKLFYAGLVAVTFFSDSLFLVFFCLPTVLASVFFVFLLKKKNEIQWLWIVLAGIALKYFLDFLLFFIPHFVTHRLKYHLAAPDQSVWNFKLLAISALDCIAGLPHFYDKSSVMAFLLFCILIMGFFLSFSRLIAQKALSLDFVDYVLLLGAVICFVVVGTSSRFDNIAGVRYITATIVFVSIFLARYFVFSASWEKPLLIAVSLGLIFCHLRGDLIAWREAPSVSLKETQKVLEENHITECYADYWSGTSTMFRIPFLVSSAIMKDGAAHKMTAYRFLSKEAWYSKKPRRCYLTSDEGDIGMIEQFFGKDYDLRTADDQYIMLYHQDVLSVD